MVGNRRSAAEIETPDLIPQFPVSSIHETLDRIRRASAIARSSATAQLPKSPYFRFSGENSMMAYLLATATASAANIMLFREDLHIHAVLAASATLTFTIYCFYAARPTSSTRARIRSTSMTKAKGVSLVSIILYALGMAFFGDSSGLSIGLAFKIASALTLTPLLFTDALLVFHDRRNHRVR